MTVERRPLLAFGPPIASARPTQTPRDLPRLSKPGAGRQGERLTPQFKDLTDAFAAERARLSADAPDEINPRAKSWRYLILAITVSQVLFMYGAVGGFA